MTVGNGAEAEIVAMLDEQGRIALERRLGFIRAPSGLDIEPDDNMLTAADVVEAIAMAAAGNGWLWLPSYVVIRTDLSSAQR